MESNWAAEIHREYFERRFLAEELGFQSDLRGLSTWKANCFFIIAAEKADLEKKFPKKR